jgi:hypothetical protein
MYSPTPTELALRLIILPPTTNRALPALHDDDIDSVVMLLWESIRVPIKHRKR